MAGLLTGVVMAAPAWADDMLIGGYAAAADAASPAAVDRPLSRASGAQPGLVLDFTPRGGAGLVGDDTSIDDPGALRFDMSIEAAPDQRLGRLGLGASAEPSWLEPPGGPPSGLIVGGAAHWSGWSLGAGYARADLFGAPTDLMAATFGYGGLTGSLAYGKADRDQDPAVDVLLLSTDLAASRWLTLESDLALGASQEEREEMAVGRLGIRLNF